jgi:hypothetical protein
MQQRLVIVAAVVVFVGGGVAAALWLRASSLDSKYRADAERIYLILQRVPDDVHDARLYDSDMRAADDAFAQLELHFPEASKTHKSAEYMTSAKLDLFRAGSLARTATLRRDSASFSRAHDDGEVGLLTKLTFGGNVSKAELTARENDKLAKVADDACEVALAAARGKLVQVPDLIRSGN